MFSTMSGTQSVAMLSNHPWTIIAYFSLELQPSCRVELLLSDDTYWSPTLKSLVNFLSKIWLSDNGERTPLEQEVWASCETGKFRRKLPNFQFFYLFCLVNKNKSFFCNVFGVWCGGEGDEEASQAWDMELMSESMKWHHAWTRSKFHLALQLFNVL